MKRVNGAAWVGGIAVLASVCGILASMILPSYYLYLSITAISVAVILLGLGLVSGAAGMIVLCQMSLAAVGAWVVTWLNASDAPGSYLIWLLLATLVSALVGGIIGGPALRLRGVNLAVITLGFAAAVSGTLVKFQFPGTMTGQRVARPDLFVSDQGFFLLCCGIFILCAIVTHFVLRGRLGSGWHMVAFSERATAASGHNVAWLKLTAFAVSGGLAGLGGGLMVGQVGAAYPGSFGVVQSLALYLLCLILAAQYFEAALIGGIMWVFIPELFKQAGIPQDWGLIVFGIMGIQALASGTTIGGGLRGLWHRAEVPNADSAPIHDVDWIRPIATSGVLDVSGLSVSFGALKVLNDVNLTVNPGEIVGLIGPNGAGKSTLIDALTGFNPRHEGVLKFGNHHISAISVPRLAQAGLRRTFQQDRVPGALTVGQYVDLVSNNASATDEVARVLAFFDAPRRNHPISGIDVGTRRLLEIVAHLCARPQILLLDEPAAGLTGDVRARFARQLRKVPATFGTSILLIEHDLNLVRDVCDRIYAIDFGHVIASGPTQEVLGNASVRAAYMGAVA